MGIIPDWVTGGSSSSVLPQTIKTTAMTFRSDHGMLKDNSSSYSDSGQDVAKPEQVYGQPARAASHTKNQQVEVAVEFEVWPYHANPFGCTITGLAAFLGGIQFKKVVTLKGGKQTIEITSDRPLPDKVAKLNGAISWEVAVHGQSTIKSDDSWGLTVYLTMGTPRLLLPPNPKQDPATGLIKQLPESGVTIRRMDKAVELVAATNSSDAHEIVEKLMSLVPGYVLNAPPGTNPNLLSSGFPAYQNDSLGGAWMLADNIKSKAQCQAIVRFVRGVLAQVGCPGDVEKVSVWEVPAGANQFPAVQNEATVPNVFEATAGGGLQFVTHPTKGWFARLADTAIAAKDVNAKEFNERMIGINVLEACLRFTHNNKKKYYAGGTTTAANRVAVFDRSEDVLKVFKHLIYIENTDRGGFFVRQIVKTY